MKLYKNKINLFLKKNNYFDVNLKKIIIHSGLAKNNNNKNYLKNAFDTIKFISGQKPIFSKIKKSISNFKSKIGEIGGVYTTLRKTKMWDFYHKLISIVIPRIKEFKGFNIKSLDRFGNFNLGIKDVNVFPDYLNDFKIGININLIIKNLYKNYKEFYEIINFPIK
ncbi:50S ribosomal protein L5 [Candidatus Carsonella ruddii]|uniref:50S ribosomal protein L5 n=1 Tax=Candidatus Carsonella ruddii HC isolate Thao2000 TaxID=1202538 RepID=J3YQ66_CARRU|nr:50S ribosomal protein L5 [Candidatus Carsonella ruddii]AFP84013.1 ribosomal protein L5 [Candidatus Carsonella ruddii HC isolate Thao2000]